MSREDTTRAKSSRSHRRVRRLLVLALLASTIAAGPAVGAPAATAKDVEPLIRTGVGTPVAIRLRSGFAIAVRQARNLPACRALFEALGSDAEKLLAATDYRAATRELESAFCSRRAVATTHVGQPLTWLCGTFSSLGAHEAAAVVLHEALHFGGMREKPATPDARTSREINALVVSRCRP